MAIRLTLKDQDMQDYSHLTVDERKIRADEAQVSLEAAEKIIELGDALAKLKATPEYKKVFLDGYFDEFAKDIFEDMTNPPKFAIMPLQDCEDTLSGIKALKSYVGFKDFKGSVEIEMQTAIFNRDEARSVLNAIGL